LKDSHTAILCGTEGVVLNVGANEDPANLKAIDPDRVINCDIEATDSYLNRPNNVDVLFDCTKAPWPFPDNHAELVVFGDIIEHLYPKEALAAFYEAHRVAEKVCITLPRDNRWKNEGVTKSESGYRTHCHEWRKEELTDLLAEAGFQIKDLRTVDYFFVPEGYFVLAERNLDRGL
jgi:predicted SAM-dependent methyltransferase